MRASRPLRRRRGFTLIEVLLVMMILVILVSFAVGTFSGVQKKANRDAARAQIGLFEQQLDLYHHYLNSYPDASQGLEALVNPPDDPALQDKWYEVGPFLKKGVVPDPWGNPYQYESPGRSNPDSYDIWSLGPDGIDGTDDDVGNWTEK